MNGYPATEVLRSDIRPCTLDDIPFIIEIGKESYPDSFNDSNAQHAVDWIKARLPLPNLLFVRGNRSFAVAHAQAKFWAPNQFDVTQLFLASRRCTGAFLLEPMYLIDYMRDWGKRIGGRNFFFGDLTGIDMKAYAERRGARLAGHTDVFDLTE